MAALVEQLRDRAPRTAYVSLIADGEARHLYGKFGFVETAPESVHGPQPLKLDGMSWAGQRFGQWAWW